MFGLRPAPELSGPGLTWFNVERPLSLSDLLGRLVILDFWTICCVNCINVLPTLQRIQASFSADAVAVVGVHSPKFPAERTLSAVANAIDRFEIRHPVIHDPELVLWQTYGVKGWPTLVFIAPDGKVLGDLPGEPDCQKLLCGIGRIVRECKPADQPKDAVQHTARPPCDSAADAKICADPGAACGRLRYPTAIKPVAAKPAGNGSRLWACADSGHHQIVLLADDGREIRRFGLGRPGFVDLDGATSAFRNPQGLVCADRFIYVADTGNHAIRRIDLATGSVSTVAGTGERGGVLRRPRPGHDLALASVWDLAVRGRRLFFANAGTHQLGSLDLDSGLCESIAGNGHEDLVDGPAGAAQLAQPSALTLDPNTGTLYFVDSEASAIRALDLDNDGAIRTIVGAGLFEYGHVNGTLSEARFQHCLGLDWWAGRIVVADSYNDVLRVVDPLHDRVDDLGERTFTCADGTFACSGPSAVAAASAERLLVADTNNHRLVELNLDSCVARTWA